jgi:uncharacterized protein YjbJ (UPF0337 family)
MCLNNVKLNVMNASIIKGTLREIKGWGKMKLSRLTGSKKMYLDGVKDGLIGYGQVRYGRIKHSVSHIR